MVFHNKQLLDGSIADAAFKPFTSPPPLQTVVNGGTSTMHYKVWLKDSTHSGKKSVLINNIEIVS